MIEPAWMASLREDGRDSSDSQRPFRYNMRFSELFMRIAVLLLIAGATLFNCWAIGLLFFDSRWKDRKKAVDLALQEIDYHLRRARGARKGFLDRRDSV